GLSHLEGMTKLRRLTIGADHNFSRQALQRIREKMPVLDTLEIRGMVGSTRRGMMGGMGGGTARGMGGGR
ncbi:MAG: hypothetical protein ACYTEE_06155, partial [Planctomycetota bacterium]